MEFSYDLDLDMHIKNRGLDILTPVPVCHLTKMFDPRKCQTRHRKLVYLGKGRPFLIFALPFWDQLLLTFRAAGTDYPRYFDLPRTICHTAQYRDAR